MIITEIGMRLALLFLVATLAAGLTACGPSRVSSPGSTSFRLIGDAVPTYQVGPGDILSVVLPYNPELNFEASVGPDGRFTMPVIGSIPAGGKTVPEIEANIDQALVERRIARNSQPSVNIRQYAPVIYVGGEVRQPGVIPLRNRMDPLQAISSAGGPLETARTDEVVVIRTGPDGRPMLRLVNLDALTESGDPNQAIALQPQDTVFVPRTAIAAIDQWVDQYLNKTIPFNRGVTYTFSKNLGGTGQ